MANYSTPMESPNVAATHKDRLFCKLFGSEEYKGNLLLLYNALNDTDYQDPDALEINTIGTTIYMSMHNDVSCIIDSYMDLFEQQSGYNPNMPLRSFLYFASLIDKYIKSNELNIYGAKLVKLPTPQCFVLYNGTKECEDREILKLSDAFIHPVEPNTFEWTVVQLNINHGHNKDLTDKCRPLYEYSFFVQKVRDYAKDYDINDAVNKAVDYCIDKGVLKEFLTAHKAEVIQVVIMEYNEQKTLDAIAKENHEEGVKKGIKEGIKKGIKEGGTLMVYGMVQDGDTSPERGAKRLNISVEELQKRMVLCGFTFPTENTTTE